MLEANDNSGPATGLGWASGITIYGDGYIMMESLDTERFCYSVSDEAWPARYSQRSACK